MVEDLLGFEYFVQVQPPVSLLAELVPGQVLG